MSRSASRVRAAAWCALLALLAFATLVVTRGGASEPAPAAGGTPVRAVAVAGPPAPITRDTPPTKIRQAEKKAERAGYVRRSRGGKIAAKGWVAVGEREDGKGFTYVLHTKEGEFELDLDDADVRGTRAGSDDPAVPPNSVVTVRGALSGSAVNVSSAWVSTVTGPPVGYLKPVSTARTGNEREMNRTVLVLRYAFSGLLGQGRTVSDAAIDTAFRTGSDSLKAYYDIVSHNTLKFTVDNPPYFELDIPRPTPSASQCQPANGNNTTFGRDEARAKATALGYNPDAYDHVVFISDMGGVCGGRAYASGRDFVFPSYTDQKLDGPVVTHEMGHALGMSHSDLMKCHARGAGVPISDKCHRKSYGDSSDVMADYQRRLHGFHAVQLGFEPTSKVVELQKDQSSTIAAMEPVGDSVTAPRLVRYRRATAQPDAGAADAWYYFDVRKPGGSFANYPSGAPFTNGVMVRLGEHYGEDHAAIRAINASPDRWWNTSGNARSGGLGSWAFDPATGARAPEQDFGVQIGHGFYDPIENVTITVTMNGPSAAAVRVASGPPISTATTVSVTGSTLSVTGSARRNVVAISSGQDDPAGEQPISEEPILHPADHLDEGDGQLIVSDFGNKVTPGAGCTAIDGQTVSCSKTAVKSIDVKLGDKDDTATVYSDITLPATLDGQAGRDVLIGGGGRTTFVGGPGPQAGSPLGVDADGFAGGTAEDTITYAGRTTPVDVSVQANATAANNGAVDEKDVVDGSIERIVGGDAADTLAAVGSAPRTLVGGPGKDTLTGGSGADVIHARDGDATETINCGGNATDKLFGDAGEVSTNCEIPELNAIAEVTSGPEAGGVTNASVPQFTFASTGTSSPVFKCKIEAGSTTGAGALSTCGSTYQPASALAEGTWTLTVQVDGAPASTATKHTFTVDTTAPVTTLTSPTDEDYASQPDTAQFTFAANESGVQYECSLNGDDFTSCLSTKKYRGLGQTLHSFRARSIDRAGNIGAPTDYFVWQVDGTPPTATFTGGPANDAHLYEAQPYTFSGNEAGVTFECSTDEAPFAACTSPKAPAFPDFVAANRTFEVRAVDRAGNVSTPVKRVFSVEDEVDTIIDGWTDEDYMYKNTSTPSFTFTSVPATGFAFDCRPEHGAAWVPCTSPFTFPASDDGIYQFQVRGRNPTTGALERTYASQIVKIDTEAPDTAISSGPAAGSTITTADTSFAFSSADSSVSDFECKLDSGTWTACTSPKALSGLTNGAHTFAVRAKDRAGNVDATPESRTFTVQLPAVLSVGAAQTPTSTTSLTGSPASLDWIHWKSATSSTVDRRNVSPQRLSTFSKNGSGAVTLPANPTTTFSWTDALGTASGSSAVGVATGEANGRGFWFTSTASNTEARTLRVYVGAKGGTSASTSGQLRVLYVNDATITPVTSSTVTAAAGATTVRAFDVTFRPRLATDSLKVEWSQTAGGTSAGTAVVLYGATVR